MSARILSGAEVAAVVHSRVAVRVASLQERGKSVGLATVLVGDHPGAWRGGAHDHRQSAGEHSGGRRAAPGVPFLMEW